MSETTEQAAKPATKEERELARLQARIEQIHELRGMDADEVAAYVYRESPHSGRTALPPHDRILQDHELGLIYGPGRYFVSYVVHMLDGSKTTANLRYNIGREYLPLHRAFCAENGLPCLADMQNEAPRPSGLSDLLTREKVESIAGIAGLLKSILAPNNQAMEMLQAQQIEMIRSMGSNKQSLPESLLVEAFKSLKPAAPVPALPAPPSLREQLDLFHEIREAVAPAPAPVQQSEDAGPMQFFIDKAMDLFPAILEKFNGNETAAAQAIKKENFLVRSMMKKPDVQKSFYRAAVENYGEQRADNIARGFGINPASLKATNTTAAPSAEQKPAAGKVRF